MMKRLMVFFVTLFLFFPSNYIYLSADLPGKTSSPEAGMSMGHYMTWFYNELNDDMGKPDFQVFKKALTGFFVLKSEGKLSRDFLTLVDFTRSSNEKRLWIIDVSKMKIVHRSLVSHGRNSGELFASRFSNIPSSYQSSLGFYVTGSTYTGKHGTSLLLEGQEPGINDKARERAIVIHSANYVSESFIQQYGRLGRSQGCPAIPIEGHREVISKIAGGSCLFIYYPDEIYQASTQLNAEDKALAGMTRFYAEIPGFKEVFSAIVLHS